MVNNLKVSLFNIADYEHPSEHPSLGLGYIVSFLRKYLDFENAHMLIGNVLNKLKKDPPDIIGISSVTEDFTKATECAKSLKELFKVPIIVGGVHISSMPESLPEYFDIAVLGEGEETMGELLKLISENGLDKQYLSGIGGIAYHQDGQVRITAARDLIGNMDTIPFPEREEFVRRGFFHILTSRGCPYRCSFCSSSLFWNKIRFFSPSYVVEEIKFLIFKFGARHISIWDDIFIINIGRFKKIVDLIQKENIHKQVSFGCSVRANLINDETCSLMKSMNVTHVGLGLESGSEKMLKYLKKGSVKVEDNKRAVDLLKHYGFTIKGSFIIGSPDETEEDIIDTLDFIRHSRLDGGIANLAVPYPGTEFWQYASKRGLVANDMDFDRLRIKTKFSGLGNKDFILLSDTIAKDVFVNLGAEIEMELARRNAQNLLSRNNLNLKTIFLALANPKLSARFIKESLVGLLGIFLSKFLKHKRD